MADEKKPKQAQEAEASQAATDEELSEEDLAAVAGGIVMPVDSTAIGSTTLTKSLTSSTSLTTSTQLSTFNTNLLTTK